MTLVAVRFDRRLNDIQRKMLREFVSSTPRVRRMKTIQFLVGEADLTSGSGASFRVEWSAAAGAADPIIEAAMIGASGGLGISFMRRGQRLNPPTDSQSRSDPGAVRRNPVTGALAPR